MVDIRTLGILLDTLRGDDESPLAARPAAAIVRMAAMARVAPDAGRAEPPVAQPGDQTTPATLARRTSDARPELRAETSRAMQGGSVGRSTDAAPAGRNVNPTVPSASLELSATAQWLQRSLLSVPVRDAAASIRPSLPLASAPPADAQALAQALRESIAQSGLFYESHLADWVVQRYPESALRREPQAGWIGAAAAGDEKPVLRTAADGSEASPVPGFGDERQRVSEDLLRAQLQALESRQFSWQGELWPGQAARMTVAEDAAAPGSEAPARWRTHLTLTLPELGQIDVDLCLDGATLQLALVSGAAHSVELMTEARAGLVSALESNTNTVASVAIRQS